MTEQAAAAPDQTAFVDTDVIIRLLTGDDPQKQSEAASLFQRAERGEVRLAAPDTVIADAVYVLASPRLYGVPRAEVRELLVPLVRLPAFHLDNKRIVLAALDIYAASHSGFGDAMIAAAMRDAGSTLLYSYNAGFDRLAGVERKTPS